jgi:hypothetical protein
LIISVKTASEDFDLPQRGRSTGQSFALVNVFWTQNLKN